MNGKCISHGMQHASTKSMLEVDELRVPPPQHPAIADLGGSRSVRAPDPRARSSSCDPLLSRWSRLYEIHAARPTTRT